MMDLPWSVHWKNSLLSPTISNPFLSFSPILGPLPIGGPRFTSLKYNSCIFPLFSTSIAVKSSNESLDIAVGIYPSSHTNHGPFAFLLDDLHDRRSCFTYLRMPLYLSVHLWFCDLAYWVSQVVLSTVHNPSLTRSQAQAWCMMGHLCTSRFFPCTS